MSNQARLKVFVFWLEFGLTGEAWGVVRGDIFRGVENLFKMSWYSKWMFGEERKQGWAILEDCIAIQILGGQNCRELAKS